MGLSIARLAVDDELCIKELVDQTIHVRIAGVDAPEVRGMYSHGCAPRDETIYRALTGVVPDNLTQKRAWHGSGNEYMERPSTAS